MAGPKHPRKFEEGFERQIVQPYDNGKPLSEITPGYDLGRSAVSRWVQRMRDSGPTRAEDSRTPERNGVIELEKESRRLEVEVEVLRTAAPMFARGWPRHRRTPADTRHRRSARCRACRGRPTTG